MGQEALEAEAVAGQSGRHHRGNAGCRPGQGADLYPLLGAGPRKQEAGVRDAGGAGIAHESHVRTCQDAVANHLRGSVLVVLVVREQPALHLEVLEQQAGGAGVFGKDQVGLPENPHSPVSHVLKVADRCRHYVEYALSLRVHGLMQR